MTSARFVNRWPLVLALVAGAASSCQTEGPADEAITPQFETELRAAAAQNPSTAASARTVRPVLACVERLGRNEFRAHFGYTNSGSDVVTIPVGFFNRFWPPPILRGQPTTFAAGSHADVIQVPFNGSTLVAWVLGLHFEIATRHSRACTPAETGGQGTGGSDPGGLGTGGAGTGGAGTGGAGTGGQGTGGVSGTGGTGTGGQGTGGAGTGGAGTGGIGVCPSNCDDHNPCTIDVCDASTNFACSNANVPDNTACTDGNACTVGDVCLSGVCTAGAPRACFASDQCHAAGVCDPVNGVCSNPTAADGASCSDNNACTSGDSCQSGMCTGGVQTICQPSDQCHAAGICSPATGVCSNPTAANGTACSDGSACTTGDSCQSGSCAPGTPKVCAALDQCHVAGVCAPATGVCSNPPMANGTTCNDGNACTPGDLCQSGACVPGVAKVCVSSGVCHVAGTCDTATGVCSDPVAPDGSTCDDGDLCTGPDSCHSGFCTGTALDCDPMPACTQCTTANCAPATDGCSQIANAADKALCETAYACFAASAHPGSTVPGPCTVSGDPTKCWCGTSGAACLTTATAANGPCRDAVIAAAKAPDPATIKLRFVDPNFPLGRAVNLSACRGTFCAPECGFPTAPPAADCSDPAVPNGAGCDDGQTCTTMDQCQDGACVGSPVADGVACNDFNSCTYQDVCVEGQCLGNWIAGCQ